jgi:hypothetical protein
VNAAPIINGSRGLATQFVKSDSGGRFTLNLWRGITFSISAGDFWAPIGTTQVVASEAQPIIIVRQE